ncbi:MAG: NAD(P)H-dependent oxidoreductase [Eubacterium sp.]|nr:NAD(P)H-dependent oxidoreductase [Eubacterium sp.]
MKITVINGTEKHGVTYRLKEIFLERFRKKAEITEFYLPKDCPSFCSGCVSCTLKGEHTCKDSEYIQKIAASLLESDLIVMTSPAYVMHTTGSMKALLDHFAYLWMPHRPAPEMFTKRAVIISQCLGAGAKSTAKDIKHSLSWWGISKITVFTGRKLSSINYEKPSRVNAITRIKFLFCRMMQKSLHKNDPQYLDGKYWAERGWLGNIRPWGA